MHLPLKYAPPDPPAAAGELPAPPVETQEVHLKIKHRYGQASPRRDGESYLRR